MRRGIDGGGVGVGKVRVGHVRVVHGGDLQLGVGEFVVVLLLDGLGTGEGGEGSRGLGLVVNGGSPHVGNVPGRDESIQKGRDGGAGLNDGRCFRACSDGSARGKRHCGKTS